MLEFAKCQSNVYTLYFKGIFIVNTAPIVKYIL